MTLPGHKIISELSAMVLMILFTIQLLNVVCTTWL